MQLPTRPSTDALRQGLLWLVDHGLPGATPLRTHVVICGFPRSGSTLLQVIVTSCVCDIKAFPQESHGLRTARTSWRTHPYLLSKRPADIDSMDVIRAHYEGRRACARFVLPLRDPRNVLTSRHPNAPGYLTPTNRWHSIYTHYKEESSRDDTQIVRYESLLGDPASVEAQLTQFIGWTVHTPFANFHDRAAEQPSRWNSRTYAALGELRALDNSGADRWTAPEHRDRLRAVLDELPYLPDALIELGYEADQSWITSLND